MERFAPATVVEFFASTEGNAVLVNLTGEKIGSLGRPLPGGGEVGVANWNLEEGRLAEHASGFAGECPPGEIGLLVELVDRERGELEGRSMRGVFEPGDAWLNTGDLVRVDDEGDYWLVDHVGDVIHATKGAVTTVHVEGVLTAEVDAIDLAAVYGLELPGLENEIPTAAVTLRPGASLDPVALRRVVRRRLKERHRPIVVRLLAELPLTAGHRTRKRSLRETGLAFDDAYDATSSQTLWLAPDEEGYIPLVPENLGEMIDHLAKLESGSSDR